MDSLYPNLNERFKSEGVCPICLMEMELAARYTCSNGHTICYRCKPYYYACPSCQSPLEMELPSPRAVPSYPMPMPSHFMPHPLPPKFHEHHHPSAPNMDFHDHERNQYPSPPSADQELISCSYENLGCWVKIPIYLIDLHESRCQFRPHLEEETVPTDVAHRHEDLVQCRYHVAGCKVSTSPWRISIHEAHCVYKDRFEAMDGLSEALGEITITSDEYGDPEELLECKFRRYGCMVSMPRRRKRIHQEKCNYRKYHCGSDSSDDEDDPEALVGCKWAKYGCMVNMPRRRKLIHQEKCNYREVEDEEDGYHSEDDCDPNELVSCKWAEYGCMVQMPRRRQLTHQEKCNHRRDDEEEYDPNEQVPCRWAEYGCMVRPKRIRLESHEEKCNYRMEECAFKDNGCSELVHTSRKYAHERRCQFAN